MQRILVIGAGALAKRVVDILERTPQREIVGLLAREPAPGTRAFEYPLLGDDDALADVVARQRVDAAIVAIGDNWRRACVARQARQRVPGLPFAAAIDPTAHVARGAVVGEGAIVSATAVVDVDARVGRGVFLCAGTMVVHDAAVADYASLGPHAVAYREVRVGECAALGGAANVMAGLTVGEHAVVGAGSLVTRAVPPYAVAYGNPARIVRKRQQGDPYL